MFDFNTLISKDQPYRYWVGKAVDDALVTAINKQWPAPNDLRWIHENGKFSKKSAIMFPNRLCDPAQELAEHMYSDAVCERLSYMVGIPLKRDPWFFDGPKKPLLGGGLHEIHPGGLLKMHVDFNRHPTGLTRCLNLLIYLNEVWESEWNGDIHLGWKVKISPKSGTTVIFETVPESWHGHPDPLACPPGVTRRSLALYYYTQNYGGDRITTQYRRD